MSEKKAVDRVGQSVCMEDDSLLETINNIDRPGDAYATGAYAGACEIGFEDKSGKGGPKAGVYAAAGVGFARAEGSILAAEAKGPNASAGVGLSTGHGARAFAKAELASASASAGPVKATVGLAVDTGVGVGPRGVEAKFLGTGFSFGRRMGISLFGSSLEFDLF